MSIDFLLLPDGALQKKKPKNFAQESPNGRRAMHCSEKSHFFLGFLPNYDIYSAIFWSAYFEWNRANAQYRWLMPAWPVFGCDRAKFHARTMCSLRPTSTIQLWQRVSLRPPTMRELHLIQMCCIGALHGGRRTLFSYIHRSIGFSDVNVIHVCARA